MSSESIHLDQYMKLTGMAGTGGQANLLIQDGQVRVNGEVVTRRKRKLVPGDQVSLGDQTRTVELED